MKIISRQDGSRNYVTDKSTASHLVYNGRINIEFRGSSSQSLPKKSYGLSTLQANNVSNNNVSLLGMPSENDWILNSLAFDNSYIRDYISYNLSNQLGNYASRAVYCEVVINGDYQGLYLLQEKLKKDSNRINVVEIQPTDIAAETITGGYITKADKTTGEDPIAWEMPHQGGGTLGYIHHLPKPENATASQTTYIKNQFLDLALQADNTSIQNGYPSLIDIPTFIDFMLINELASNADGYQFSTFFHKDRGGKLRAGPIWDFNLTYGNDLFLWGFNRSKTNVWQFNNNDNNGSTFWFDLFNNSTFKCYLSKRWNELIQTGKPLHQTNINLLIDRTITHISEAVNRDANEWFSEDADLEPKVNDLKNFITERKLWLTDQLGLFSTCSNPATPDLVISKIHYNPLALSGTTSNDQEFIELTNAGTTTINLSGIYFKALGISYQFPYNSTVSAGQKIYLASNVSVFTAKNGFPPFGQFSRNLSNTSQKLELADAFGNTIDMVEYSDSSPWPTSPDGTGTFLELINLSFDHRLASNWKASSNILSPQVTLGTSPYSQDFNSLGTGLPTGWSVRTGASASALGATATLVTANTSWISPTGNFRNVAAASGLTAASTTTDQNNSVNRALAIRQTSNFGDPGAAFVLQLANTTGLTNFQLSFKLQSLDGSASGRTTTWRVDYGLGSTPTSFTPVATTPAALTTTLAAAGASWGSTDVTVNFGTMLDNSSDNVWVRITTLAPSTGSGSRPTSAIDDFQLSYATSDITPPTFTATYPKTSNLSSSGFNLLTNLNEIGKTYLVVLPNNAIAPTSAQVKNGQDATGTSLAQNLVDSVNVSVANFEYAIAVADLSDNTDYDVYVVAEDLIPNIQAAPTKIDVKTNRARDVTPPIFTATYPIVNTISANSFTVRTHLDESGKTYFVVLPTAATAPSSAQVKSSQDGSGVAVAGNLVGTINVTAASTEFTSVVSGLS
ncbi:MAG: CotH kinase family protein, partial [Cyclobacteriaceae bacterium]|nr:CotH kinase family protein [Cyclobacteriaceae bacterium]